MFTLESFYKSTKWETFRRSVIEDRTNKRGEVICAFCGRPIVNKYDLIAHHKIELTEQNVNDYMISLNPDNIDLIHFRCHNIIHDRFQGGDQWKPRPKRVFIVYGSPLSGKTTWVHDNAGKNDLIVDLDSIYQAVSINDRYEKSGRLSSVAFAIRDKLYEIIKYRDGKWIDAYVITGAPLRMDRERLEQRLRATSIFIDTPKEVCLQRLKDRAMSTKAREQWKEYIEDWFEHYQP